VRVSHFPSGVVLEATVRDAQVDDRYFINVRIYVPETYMYQGQVRGLFGNFDGVSVSDLRDRDGDTAGSRFARLSNCTFEIIFETKNTLFDTIFFKLHILF